MNTLALIGPVSQAALVMPMVGRRITAGFPSPADDFLDDDLDVAELLRPNAAATFFWRVSGHSMVEAGIHDGDLIVVDRSLKPSHGRVVLVTVNGEPSLKLFEDVGKPRLAYANATLPAFALDEISEVEIWGVVTWSLHKPERR